jgi:hypothetical protein
MSYAQASDVEARLGRSLDDTETIIVNARLGDAELVIKSRIPDLVDQVTAGTIDEAVVVMVESDMILRLIRNPEGYTQESDGNYSYTISTQVASGRLEVLESEWSMLGLKRGAFTIAPYLELPTGEAGSLTPYTMDKALLEGWA